MFGNTNKKLEEAFNEKQTVIKSDNSDLLCADCNKTFDVPFDNGDGKTRCAGCAEDYYFRHPLARVAIKRTGIIDLNCRA